MQSVTEPLYVVRSQQWNDWLGRDTNSWEGDERRAGRWPLDKANELAGKHQGYIEQVESAPGT